MPEAGSAMPDQSSLSVTGGLRRFQRFTMAHPRLLEVRDRLLAAINAAAPGSLVFVLGPTGVGKTTLRMKTEQALAQQMLAALQTDAGRLPSVGVEAVASSTGYFNWRDHFARMLRRIDEPLIEEKGQHMGGERNGRGQFAPFPRAAGFELQYAVEQALRHRRPAAVFIDEAQHLARIASGRRLLDQLDVVKSIANRTATVHVLLGTYELLGFRNLSGQLSRRSLDVHFARYFAEDKEDVETFKNVLATFQAQLPLPSICDLVDAWDLMYERSVGCVGILKEWLLRALTTALANDKAAVSRAHLERTALSASQCEKILAEARDGEEGLKESDGARARLRTLLGLECVRLDPPARQCEPVVPIKRTGGAGRRSPKRDRVGARTAACG